MPVMLSIVCLDEPLRHSQIAVMTSVCSEVSTKATREALRHLGERLGGVD